MKNLFKFVFSAFKICGMSVFGILLAAGFNEVLLKWFGPAVTVPHALLAGYLVVFKYCGIITILTFPTVLINAIARSWKSVTPENWWPTVAVLAFMFIFFFVTPVVILIAKGELMDVLIMSGIMAISALFGGQGNKYPIPFEDGLPWHNRKMA